MTRAVIPLFFVPLLVCFGDRVSYILGWPPTHYVVEGEFELLTPLASISRVLGLPVCTAMPGSLLVFCWSPYFINPKLQSRVMRGVKSESQSGAGVLRKTANKGPRDDLKSPWLSSSSHSSSQNWQEVIQHTTVLS